MGVLVGVTVGVGVIVGVTDVVGVTVGVGVGDGNGTNNLLDNIRFDNFGITIIYTLNYDITDPNALNETLLSLPRTSTTSEDDSVMPSVIMIVSLAGTVASYAR